MKAKLRAQISDISKNVEVKDGHTTVMSMTKLRLRAKGKVEIVDTTLNTNAQLAMFDGELALRGVIADQMKIGATITIIISDENESSNSEVE